MNNKVFVKIIVPEVDKSFDVYLPITKKMGNINILLNKAISEITLEELPISQVNQLYNADTMERYNPDTLLANTNIRNGSTLILLS